MSARDGVHLPRGDPHDHVGDLRSGRESRFRHDQGEYVSGDENADVPADPRRFWDFRSLGHGDIDFEEIIVALNDIRYTGPLSVEWEDSRMDRVHGAAEACEFVRSVDFPPSELAFDAQFDQ